MTAPTESRRSGRGKGLEHVEKRVDQNDREDHARIRAAMLGLALKRSRPAGARTREFVRYTLVDAKTGASVVGDEGSEYALSLDQVEEYLRAQRFLFHGPEGLR